MDCSRIEQPYEISLSELSKSNRYPWSRISKWDLGSDYEFSRTISRYGYENLYEFTQKFTGSKVVIQCFNDDVCEDTDKGKKMLRVLILLKSLEHPYILNVADVISSPASSVYIIYNYAQSHLKNLFKSPIIYFEMLQVKVLMYNILVAIKYVHSASVVHGDLKPINVFINEDYSIKICSFGRAKCLKQPKNVDNEEKKWNKEDSDDEDDVQSKNDPKLYKMSDTKSWIDSNPPNKGKSRLLRPPNGLIRQRRHRQILLYEAPETLFPDQDQTLAVDIWSLGCIFSELLHMIRENAPTFLDRCPLFIGNCSDHKGYFCIPGPSRDHLNIILSMIGTPEYDDLNFIKDKHVVEYLKSVPAKKPMNFDEMYSTDVDGSADALDLLKRMLQFNPHKRMTVDECLNHPFFSVCRDKSKEMKYGGSIIIDPRIEKATSPEELHELMSETLKDFNFCKGAKPN